MYFSQPINDCHIHLFHSRNIDECLDMVDYCGYQNWTYLACTVIDDKLALTQNLLGALLKLKDNGRCKAFASFHYHEDMVPDAEELLRQIKWFDEVGFDGIKMLDGKPTIRKRIGVPLDHVKYDMMFEYAERKQFPILYHINDPIEFWHYDRLPQWAKESGNYYGDGDFPHKFDIDEEALRMMRKHPNLKLCIPHFFFLSDQFGLCCELLERYPSLYLDITPGWEMFENFAKDLEVWRKFFIKYSDRILFGSDTYSDHWKETVGSLKRVMETDEEFIAFEESCIGLSLPKDTLNRIYYENYYDFNGNSNKPIDVKAVLEYADRLYGMVGKEKDSDELRREIIFLRHEIERFL